MTFVTFAKLFRARVVHEVAFAWWYRPENRSHQGFQQFHREPHQCVRHVVILLDPIRQRHFQLRDWGAECAVAESIDEALALLHKPVQPNDLYRAILRALE